MRNLLILFLAVSLLFSCEDKNDCNGFDDGKEFEIAVDETLKNCPKNVSITLLDIQDSRCPTGAQCIWAGMIIIEVQLKIDGMNLNLKLSTNESASGFADEFSTAKYKVKLIDVFPYPDLIKPNKLKDKRVILVISSSST